MHFWKMQGCGNDYVVLDGRRAAGDGLDIRRGAGGQPDLAGDGGEGLCGDRPALARRLCDRHYGIGGDGMLLVRYGSRAEFEMEMYNPDGSRGEMCGNGMRCAGRYIWERGWTKRKSFTVESMGAVKRVEVLDGGLLRVSMGTPLMEGSRSFALSESGLRELSGDEKEGAREKGALEVYCVSMGNPHAILLCGEGEELQVERLGPLLEKASCFPDRTNVEFVTVTDRHRLDMRVWERGAGETLACGTGACAAAAVCMQKGLTEEEITVTLLGGRLLISTETPEGSLSLTGPAVKVFEGEIF